MRTTLLAVFLFVSGTMPAGAAPQMGAMPQALGVPMPLPPAVSPACVNARDSADYVPGVDVHGRPVAPADLPGSADVQISTEVYPILKSKNPQLNGVGVVANLPGLANRPLCPPPAPQARPVPHR